MSIIEPHTEKSKLFNYYHQILENSADVIYLIEVTPEGRFIHLDINPAYLEASGLPREAIVGRYVDEIENEAFRTILLDKYSSCFNAKKQTDYIADYPLPSGIKTYHSTLSPMFDENGRLHRIVGVARDITERKRAEEALAMREREFHSLAENIPDNIARWDCAGRYLYINPVHERTLGKTPSEVIGTFIPDNHKEVRSAITQVVATGEEITVSQTVISQDGRTEYHEVSLVPERDASGKILSVLGIGRDITDKKTQEERLLKTKAKLSAVISTIPDLIWVKDAEGVYMMCNPAVEHFFGVSADQFVGNTDYDFMDKDAAEACKLSDLEAIAADTVMLSYEPFVHPYTGTEGTWEIRKIPISMPNGESMGILGIARDITEHKKMESKIAKQKDFQNTLLLSIAEAGLGIHVIENGQYIYTNDIEKAKKYGYDETIVEVKPNFLDTIHPDDRAKALDMYTRRLRGEDVPSTYELGVVQKNGRRREHSVSVIVIPNTDPIQTIVVTQDISERKQLQQTIQDNEKRLKEAQKIAKVGSWELEFPELKLSWSDEIYRIFEIDQDEFHPSYDYFLNAIHPEDRNYIDTVFNDSLQNKTTYDVVHRLLMRDGRIKYVHEIGQTAYDDEGNPIRSIGTVQDITQHKSAEKKIEHMAHHDALTGLPNRTLAKIRAEQIMAQAKRSDSKAAFLFIDLDGFKAINDTLGHSAGDSMLKSVSSRLKECVRESDMISRQGGDEFLLVLSNIQEADVIASIAKKILAELEKSFEINFHPLFLSGSIGIALYPDHGETFETLLQSADTAMYKAKESGKNSYHFYTQQMTHHMIGQFKIQNDLKNALDNNEFILFYQPQIDLTTHRIIGAEALIRWRHPMMGMMPPMSFIPIAESSGMIVQIGQWVIEESCRQAALWQEKGIEITVAVNISAMQFKRGNLESIVENALISSQIDPKYLELELTESIIMHDADNTLQSVRNLKELGVQLSIDDFGTGYSSLAYLKRFAVDKLKIDQSFVRDILSDQDDAIIVQTIIQMAKNLNLKTIAEGVESEDVLALINSYGCDEVQGYHFAKPMEASEFEHYHRNFVS